MGQNNSAPLGGRRKSFRSSWRPRLPHRSHSHKGNLSATFNVLDVDAKIDQLNVNVASEEELMTLPGVSRSDAHNIVEYRLRLGRFKKVEDLALVSGIGADKLALIRPEICVGLRRSPSCASSRAQSTDSLPSVEVKPSPRPPPLVNVNFATVFELQAIPGFTQEIAANVIDYRDTHGNFRTLDQLTKVKGINQIRLGAVRARLTVNSELSVEPIRNGFSPALTLIHSTPKTSPRLPPSRSIQPIANGQVAGHRKSMSVPVKLQSAANGLAVHDILDVLSACSPRPIVEDHFDGKRRGRRALRLASWNLTGLSTEKAENPGVKEVICRTILENRFSIVALQDIIGNVGLKQICDELNFPSLRRVREWKENSHRWHNQYCNGLGYLWDSNDDVRMSAINAIDLNKGDDSVEAVYADFMVGSLQIAITNVLFYDSFSTDKESTITTTLYDHCTNGCGNQIVVGDFSMMQDKIEGCNDVFGKEFIAVLPSKVSTNAISLNHYNAEKLFNDNMYINKSIHNHYTDMSGVIRQGLTHLAIPRNWSWGGPASEHCPVWCEIYLENKPFSPSMIKKG